MSNRNKRKPKKIITRPGGQRVVELPVMDISTFEPCHDFVVVKKLEPEERPSGLIIPDSEDSETVAKAVVLKVGPGKESELMAHAPAAPCDEGDIIAMLPPALITMFIPFYPQGSADMCAIIRFRDVVGVFEKAVQVDTPEEEPKSSIVTA